MASRAGERARVRARPGASGISGALRWGFPEPGPGGGGSNLCAPQRQCRVGPARVRRPWPAWLGRRGASGHLVRSAPSESGGWVLFFENNGWVNLARPRAAAPREEPEGAQA